MFSRRHISEDAQAGQEGKERMTIMTVCEDRLTGVLSKRLFDHIAGVMGRSYEIHRSLWDFNVLGALPAEAATEARAADMVLVSVYGHGNWPPAVEKWLGLWRGEATARHCGLALLLVRWQPDISNVDQRRASLEQVVRGNGRNYFFAEIWIGGPEYRSTLRMIS